jgi:hypothetical protein
MSRTTKLDAAPGKIDDYGAWYTFTAVVPDVTLIKVLGVRKVGGHGAPQHRAAVILQSREQAALQRVVIETTRLPFMTAETAAIQGRFDILTEEQLDTEFPDLLTPYMRRDMISARVARTFQFETVAAEIAPRPVLTGRATISPDGERVLVRTQRRVRSIEI